MFNGTLYPYQERDVQAMIEQGSMLVAYDLGTGKTVMTLAAIEALRDLGQVDTTLVVVLASLKYQWADAVHQFTDQQALVIDGTPAQRAKQYATVRDYSYVVVNYEQVVNDWMTLSRLFWSALVCDEATAIKSFRSKRSRRIKVLSTKVSTRFALTGTPVENGRPEEIFSIMQMVDRKVLGNFVNFDGRYITRNRWGAPESYKNLDELHDRLKGYIVRKTQADPDVAKYLPATIERPPLRVRLRRDVAKVYNRIADDLLHDLEQGQQMFGQSFSLSAHYGVGKQVGGPEDALRGRAMAKVTALRMLTDHPGLIVRSYENYQKGIGGSAYVSQLLADEPTIAATLRPENWHSPKLDLLINLVNDHLDADDRNKVVVFTSFRGMADIIQSNLKQSVLYTGSMDAKAKERAKKAFQTQADVRVLVSSDAGGYGVDLPQGNLLINYDLPWNAGLSAQRNARIRRASSTWPSIVVQDLLAEDTIDVRMHTMRRDKNAVSGAVVDGEGTNVLGGVDLTAGSLISFLRACRP